MAVEVLELSFLRLSPGLRVLKNIALQDCKLVSLNEEVKGLLYA
jgi:hypothetical protein